MLLADINSLEEVFELLCEFRLFFPINKLLFILNHSISNSITQLKSTDYQLFFLNGYKQSLNNDKSYFNRHEKTEGC